MTDKGNNNKNITNNPDIEAEISDKEKLAFAKEKKEKLKKEKEKLANLEKLSNLTNPEIEKAVIYVGLQYHSEDFIDYLTENNIKEEYFITPIAKFIFNISYQIFSEKNSVDFLMLKEELDKRTEEMKKKKISLGDYLNFQGFIPKKELAKEYSIILTRNHRKNTFSNLALNLEKALKAGDEKAAKYIQGQIADFKYDVDDLANVNPDLGLMTNEYLANQFEDYINGGYKESKSRVKTGIKKIDEQIGGFERGNFIIFGARPSVGKSVTMLNVMDWMTKQGHRCVYISAEMYGKYLYSRWLSIKNNVSQDVIRNPSKMKDKDKEKLLKFNGEASSDTLSHFYYDTVITARDIEEVIREVESKHGKVDAVFIDYIGKLYPNNLDTNRPANAYMTDISKEVFQLGGKLDIVTITASQLSRGNVKDHDEPGMVKGKMTDLRDSGSLEQDADQIVMIRRNVTEAQGCVTVDDVQDFFLDWIKNRNGNIGEIKLSYAPKTFILSDPVSKFYLDDDIPEEEKNKIDKKAQHEKMAAELTEGASDFISATEKLF